MECSHPTFSPHQPGPPQSMMEPRQIASPSRPYLSSTDGPQAANPLDSLLNSHTSYGQNSTGGNPLRKKHGPSLSNDSRQSVPIRQSRTSDPKPFRPRLPPAALRTTEAGFDSSQPSPSAHGSFESQQTRISDFRMPPARYPGSATSSPSRSSQPYINGSGFAASPSRGYASNARASLFKPSNPQALRTEPDLRSRESLQLRKLQAAAGVHSWSGPLTDKQLGGGIDTNESQTRSRREKQSSSVQRQDRQELSHSSS